MSGSTTTQHVWVIAGAVIIALLLQTLLLIDISSSVGRIGAQVHTLDGTVERSMNMMWNLQKSAAERPSASSAGTAQSAAAAVGGEARPIRRARFLVTIICAPQEFERRALLRDTVLRSARKQAPVRTVDAATGVVREELMVVYRFVMGALVPVQTDADPRHNFKPFEDSDQTLLTRLAEEEGAHGDLLRLTLPEGRDQLTLKRMHALMWAHTQTLVDEYDFLLMMDTDTYVRFDQLYARMRDGMDGAPVAALRTTVYGYMGYMHKFPDPAAVREPGLTTDTEYMVGQAITFTPPLVRRLVERRFELWLGFPYPLDDVALGHWISIVVAAHPALHYDAVPLKVVRNNGRQLDTNSDNANMDPSRWDTFHHIDAANMMRLGQRLGDEPVGAVAARYD